MQTTMVCLGYIEILKKTMETAIVSINLGFRVYGPFNVICDWVPLYNNRNSESAIWHLLGGGGIISAVYAYNGR